MYFHGIEPMKIYIKNMVCRRCILAVEQVLINHNIPFQSVQLGEVTLTETPTTDHFQQLDRALLDLGFERIDDRKAKTIDQIKKIIIGIVHHREEPLQINLSEHLSRELHHDYAALSKLFSETEGITIEKYFIAQKIEKVKELLLYDELTLSEIAWQMDYSSVAYLSSQFKKQTGLTPSFFKSMKSNKRKNIEDI